MKRLLTWLRHTWAEYVECHNRPIIITHAGILGPIHPDWNTNKEQ